MNADSRVILTAAVAFVLMLIATAAWTLSHPAQTTPANIIAYEQPTTTAPDESINAALIALAGATQLSRQNGYAGSYHVSYKLIATYPATHEIQSISTRLKALGWRPLKNDWLNPTIPSSHVRGWTQFGNATTKVHQAVHQWHAQWTDPAGNIVNYTLRYSYPVSSSPDLQTLSISAAWFPAATAKAMPRN